MTPGADGSGTRPAARSEDDEIAADRRAEWWLVPQALAGLVLVALLVVLGGLL